MFETEVIDLWKLIGSQGNILRYLFVEIFKTIVKHQSYGEIKLLLVLPSISLTEKCKWFWHFCAVVEVMEYNMVV